MIDLTNSSNLLLAAMSPADQRRLAPAMTSVVMEREHLLARSGVPPRHTYFLLAGVASVVALTSGERTEVGIFGREGMSNTATVLGAGVTPHETFIQVAPAPALQILTADLCAAMADSPSLQSLLLRYVQVFLVQVANSAVSNGRAKMEQRLARWLLMCHDRSDGDEIQLTHEFMAMMVAAQRTGVTLTLHVMEGEGLIRSLRGRVVILDRPRLEALAGDCYGVAEAEYRRLIGPFGRAQPRHRHESAAAGG